MKYGVVFPQTEFPTDAGAVKAFVQAAEDIGYHHVLAYDHVVGVNPDREGGWSGPYSYTDPFQEPMVLFSFMAGLTKKIRFVTGIIILPQRQTVLFAKQAATLDVLCEGRLRLGVAIGWNEAEYTALNKDFYNREDRFEEQVEVLRELWTNRLVTFNGKWHLIPDAGLNPLPLQQPIPLWFGGHADPVLQRVAKMADGWLPNYSTAQDGAEALATLKGYLAEEGRSIEDIGIEPRLRYNNGDPEEWRTIAEDWESAGATHMTVITMGAGFKSAEEHIKAIEEYAEALDV